MGGPSVKIVLDADATHHLQAMIFGRNTRDGQVHLELHKTACACAFHPFDDGKPSPHWHACSKLCAVEIRSRFKLAA